MVTTPPEVSGAVAKRGQFEHLGLLYRHTDEYVSAMTSFVHKGLAADDPVLVAVPGPNLDLIRDGLGDHGGRVTFADMAVAGRNPGRIIPGVLLAFAARHPGRRVWIIGEPIWPGRTTVEYPACAAHEALINVAFEGQDAAILCPYDAGRLDPGAVADSHLTHPVMVEGLYQWPSTVYDDPVAAAATFNRPLPDPPAHAESVTFEGYDELVAVRRFLISRATGTGLTDDQIDDLTIAVNELATNTCEHTDGAGVLRIWSEDGAVVCQVNDGGHVRDPMAGRFPPTAGQRRGRGLFLVNQVCDLVRLHTDPGSTAIRVHMATSRA
jgi:anti-sigma regulatory factor (Ser/Thr protein kinase)